MSTECEMRSPSDSNRRQRSFCIARPVPDAPGAKKQHPSPPRTGRGSRGGATVPTSRIAEDRACLGLLYATAGDRPTGRARHLRRPIVPVHFAYAAATTAAPCPTDAWPLRLDIVRLAWTDRPVVVIAAHGTTTFGQPAHIDCQSTIARQNQKQRECTGLALYYNHIGQVARGGGSKAARARSLL